MKKLLLICCFVFMICYTYCQTNKTTAKQFSTMLDSINALADRGSYDSIISLAQSAIQLAKRIKDNASVAKFAVQIGDAYAYKTLYDSAFKYFKLCETTALAAQNNLLFKVQLRIMNLSFAIGNLAQEDIYFEKIKKEIDTARSADIKQILYEGLGSYYVDKNEYEKSIDAYLKCVQYAEQKKDTDAVAVGFVNIGNIYLQMTNQNKKALYYFLQAYPLLADYKYGQIICSNNIGVAYLNMKQYDSATVWTKNSIKIARELKDSSNIYAGYEKLSYALIYQKQFDEAESYLKQAIGFFTKRNEISSLIDGYTFLGQLYLEKKDYKKSLQNLSDALKIAHNVQHTEREVAIYKQLAESADSAALYKDAYYYQTQYSILSDSLTKESNKKNIVELETKYQTKNKEQQISLLNQQAQLKDAQLSVQRRTRWFLFAALCLFAGIAIIIYRNFLLKKKTNTQLEIINKQLDDANQSKTKLFSIISHDLRAPVSNLFNYLETEKENNANNPNPETESLRRRRIQDSATKVLDAMEDILYWSKTQMERFVPNNDEVLLSPLIDEVGDMYQNMLEQKNISLSKSCPSDLQMTTDPNILKIILRNLLNNAIKFTPQNGTINIVAQKENDKTKISIGDNGQGMTEMQVQQAFEWNSIRSEHSGLGLKLTKEFVEKLNGSISINTEVGSGTTFILLF